MHTELRFPVFRPVDSLYLLTIVNQSTRQKTGKSQLSDSYQMLTEMRVAFSQKWRRCPALSGGAIKLLPTPGMLGLLGVPLGLLGQLSLSMGQPPPPQGQPPPSHRHCLLTPMNDFPRTKYCCSCNYYYD